MIKETQERRVFKVIRGGRELLVLKEIKDGREPGCRVLKVMLEYKAIKVIKVIRVIPDRRVIKVSKD